MMCDFWGVCWTDPPRHMRRLPHKCPEIYAAGKPERDDVRIEICGKRLMCVGVPVVQITNVPDTRQENDRCSGVI
jgi:hypothetical protein